MGKGGQKQAGAKRPASSAMVIAGPRGWLMGKVTGQARWDFPKGRIEEGEDPLAAALRETKEECGLDLSGKTGSIVALGRFDYMPDKDLHAFYWYDEEGLADPAACRCESMVELPGREPFPEMGGFEWVEPGQAPLRVGKSLAKAIREWIAPQAQRLSAERQAQSAQSGSMDRQALLKALCRDPASALEWARSAIDGDCPELREAALELARRPPERAKRGAGGALWHLRMKLLGMGDAGGALSMADEGDWQGLAAAFERAGDWIGGPGRDRQLRALSLAHERAAREPSFMAYLRALPEQDAGAWLGKAFRSSGPTALTAALCEYGAMDAKAQLRWLSEHLPGGKGQESPALDRDGACALALGALRASAVPGADPEAARKVIRQVCKAGPAGLELCQDAALAGVLRAALAARAQGMDMGPGLKMLGRSPGWLMALGCDCAAAGHGMAACEAFEWLYKAPGGRCAQPKSCYVDEKGCKRRRGPGRILVAGRQGISSWGIRRERDVFETPSLGPVGDLVLRGDMQSAERLARLGVKFQKGKDLARAQSQLEALLAKVSQSKPGQGQLGMAHGMMLAWGDDPAAVPKGWAARMAALALDLDLPAGPVRQARKPGI